jgi:hypothetical protein
MLKYNIISVFFCFAYHISGLINHLLQTEMSCCKYSQSRVSAVGIAMGYGLDGRGSIPIKGKKFSLLPGVQTGSGDHPTSYTMGAGDSFPGGKTAGA